MGGGGPGFSTAVLQALDAAVALVFVSPLVVAYWRGCWQLMDQLLFPESFPISVYSSIFIGIVPHLLFCVFQKYFAKLTNDNVFPAVYLLASRLYTVVFSIACVSHWRGVWLLWDLYTGLSWQSGLLSFGLGFSLLIIANGVSNILAPPFVSYADEPNGYFTVPTLFNPQAQTRNTSVWLWLTDCTFTVVVVDSLVVFVWRGGWLLLDSFLYPGKPQLSAVGSTIIGASISVIAFMTRPLLNGVLKSLRQLWIKISVELCFYAFCFAATVNVWRGVWKCLDQFFLPNNRLMSNLVSAVVGQTVLLLFWCSNSNLVRGAVPDLHELGRPGVAFSVSYLSYFWRKCHDEKEPSGDDLWPTPRDGAQNSKKNNPLRKCNGGISALKLSQCHDQHVDLTEEMAPVGNHDGIKVTNETATVKTSVSSRSFSSEMRNDASPVQQKSEISFVQSKESFVQSKESFVQSKDMSSAQTENASLAQDKDISQVQTKDQRETLQTESVHRYETD